MIDDFRGPYRWLSNFHVCDVEYEGVIYPSSEHAYQAAKTLNSGLRELVRTCPRPRDAKLFGMNLPLRSDWEDVKRTVMRDVLADKFTRHDRLRNELVATGDQELIEGNTWHDTFWGMCRGGRKCSCTELNGQNHLGRLLMRIRTELQKETT